MSEIPDRQQRKPQQVGESDKTEDESNKKEGQNEDQNYKGRLLIESLAMATLPHCFQQETKVDDYWN